MTVHAYGTVHPFHDAPQLLAHLNALTNRHECGQAQPWVVADAPAYSTAEYAEFAGELPRRNS